MTPVPDPPAIEDTIATLRRQVAASPQDIQGYLDLAEREAVLQLVDLLRLRFNVLGELGDLSAAIECEQQILGVLTAEDEDRAEVLYQLGIDFAARHDQQTETAQDDAVQAIACLRELRGLIGDDHPGRPELATRLGLMLGYRVLQTVAESSDEDFAEAVKELTLARGAPTPEEDITAENAADSWLVRFRLGMVHAFRYLNRGGDAADRDAAVAELSELTDHPDTTTEQADGCHLTLALLEYLRTAPVALRRGPELLTANGQARLWDMMGSFVTGHGADTARAIRHHLDAMSESSATDPQLSMLVRGLRAATLTHNGPKGKDVSTTGLNDAVSWLDDVTPEFTEFGVTNELAALKGGIRAALVGTIGPADSAEDSATAIATIERLLAELPDDHPDRARALTRASASLYTGMALNRSEVSFDRVRDMLNRAIERPAADDANDSLNHFLLGSLNGIQGALEHDIVLINSGVDLLNKAIETAPEGHPVRSMIGPALGTLLYSRALAGGDLEDYDAAEFYADLAPADEGPESTGLRHTMRALGDYLAASAKLARNRHNLDRALLDDTIEKMTAAVAPLSDDHHLHQEISSTIDALLFARNALGLAAGRDLTSVNPEILKDHVDTLLTTARDTPEGRLDHALATGTAAMALVGQAFMARDRHSLDRGISMLGEVCTTPELTAHERLSALGCLSMSLRMRYEHFRHPRDLNNAIDRLEQAELLIQQSPPDGADAAPILHLLGDCYHERADPHRRDRQRAVDAGLQALRERANDVLLQNNSEHALGTAIAAGGEAADVARWCLAAGRNDTAVVALELGRAIVLHFATIDAGIPQLLHAGGHPALAAEWEAASDRTSRTDELPWNLAQGQDPRARAVATMMASLGKGKAAIPGDLRRRVLEAVEGTDTYARLLDPPSVADITAALAATASSALVYLLAADEGHPGLAVIVHADGTVQPRELPGLRSGAGTAFDAFGQARRALLAAESDSAKEAAWQRWQSRLNDVCDWAWTAAMGELLSVFGRPEGGRPARLVLVPAGELGAVPWHAARRNVPGGEWRHACQDAVITYASSARQFVDASRRRTLPWASTPAVVCGSDEPTAAGELPFAAEETEEIHRHFYPEGTYLGAGENGATATRIRGLLPSKHSAGASLLHLACHATLANPPINSFLELADNSTLYVRDMLEQARDRPVDAESGLVILAACESDLTGGAHDEALTLATAFLAAGSVGVVGARWPVDDAPTALFMVMFHHYLNRGYSDPATALRAAQRWMLDKRRQLPEGIGHRLADELSRPDLTETANWAAFTYQGQ